MNIKIAYIKKNLNNIVNNYKLKKNLIALI
jgi:hypothetical protein